MDSAWIRKAFPRVAKFLKINEGWRNFWGELILQNVWIIWSPLLYLNFKSFLDPNSSPFISFQCIFKDWGVPLSWFSNFYKFKREDLISGGNQFCRMFELFGPPLLYFNLKSSMDLKSSSFITFQSILHKWGRIFRESWKFYKLKRGDLISCGNHFCRISELFGAAFCISILKVF